MGTRAIGAITLVARASARARIRKEPQKSTDFLIQKLTKLIAREK